MKIGLCLEMALLKLPFEARVRKAAELGFKYVEMWWVDSSFKGTPEQLARLADDCGVKITDTVINAPDGSMGGNLTDPGRNMDAFYARAQMTLEYTREAQIPATIVLPGNRVPGLDEKTMEETFVERLKRLVEMAEKTFSLPARVGWPRGLAALPEDAVAPEFAVIVGLALYGARAQEAQAIEQRPSLASWLMGLLLS